MNLVSVFLRGPGLPCVCMGGRGDRLGGGR